MQPRPHRPSLSPSEAQRRAMQAAYAYQQQQQQQQQQRPYQQTARPHRSSSSASSSSAYNPVPVSPSLSLSGFPDADDLTFTDQAMLMLSDTEMPPIALPSASSSSAAAAAYAPLQSPHSSPVPRHLHYGEQPLQVGASSSSSSSLPPHHRHPDAYQQHSLSPQPPPSPPTYDAYGHSGGSYSPSQSYPRRAVDVKSESSSSHPAQYQHGSSSGRSPRLPYAYHGVAMPAVPHPYQQLRSVSATTSPRLVPAAAPSQLQHVSASYPSSPPQPAFTVQSATALPPRGLHPAVASSSSSSPSSGSSSPAALSASHLLSALTAGLSSSSSTGKLSLPVDEILAEATRQMQQQQHASPPGSSSPSPLLSPRHISPSASNQQDRKLIAMELQSFTGLLLAVAASAAQRTGQDRRAAAAEAVTQATVVPAAVQSQSPSYPSGSPLPFPTALPLPPHRGSLPALLPSALYSPHITHDNQQQQFARHTSRSRSKSRRRHRHQQRSRHRSATPAGEGERGREAGSLLQAEDVAHKLEELSFDEGDGQNRRAAAAESEVLSRVAAGGRSRSLSTNRQSSRDRSLSVKRKRQSGSNIDWATGSGIGDVKGEAQHAFYEGGQEAGGGGGDDDESSVSSYDSDDDSMEEEDGAMLDDATFDSFMPPLDETLAAFPDSNTNSIFSPFDTFPAAATGAVGSSPPHASSSSTTTSPSTASPPGAAAAVKRKPGRPSKPGGPARPRPRTVYSPLNEEELRQRRLVKLCLQRENITQSDLARIAGVSKASMCTWLQGSTSTNMHSKIWTAAVRWMRSVEDRHREQSRAGQQAGGGGAERRDSGGQGREDRGGAVAEEASMSQEAQTRRSPLSASDTQQPQQPVSPATTASTHSSSSQSSSSTA